MPFVNAGGSVGGTPTSRTFLIPWTQLAGDTFIVWVNSDVTAASFTISDTSGNTLTPVGAILTQAGNAFQAFIGNGIAGAAPNTNTLTITTPGGITQIFSLYVAEYSGLQAVLDGVGVQSVTGFGTAISIGGTTTNPNDTIIAVANMGFAITTLALNAPFTQRFANDSSGECGTIGDDIVTSTGTYTATFTAGSSSQYAAWWIPFKTAATTVTPNITGTISVTGSVTPSLSKLNAAITGNIGVTGSIPNVQLVASPAISGQISISGAVVPTLSQINLAIAGQVNVVGVVNPLLKTAQSISGLISVSGAVTPTLQVGPVQPHISGLVSVSGRVTPMLVGPPIPPATGTRILGLPCPTTALYPPVVNPGQNYPRPEGGPRTLGPGCSPGFPALDFSGGPWQR